MQVALTLLVSAVQIYEVYLIYQCFFDRSKVSNKGLFAGYLGLYVFTSCQYCVVSMPIINFLTGFLGFFIMTLLYDETWKNRMVAFCFNFAAMFAAEAIVSALFGYVNAAFFEIREYYSYFGMVCLPLVQFLIVIIIRNFKNLHKKEMVSSPYWIVSIALPVLSIYLYFQICSQLEIGRMNLLLCSVVIMLINILVIFLYDKQLKSSNLIHEKEVLQLQNIYQQRQYKVISESIERIRKHQHDFRNHLNSLYYFGEKQDWTSMQAYIGQLREHIMDDTVIIKTGCIIFDGILNYKLQTAKQERIDMQVEALIPSDIMIEPCDVTVVVGNLLDNSIEATRGKKDSWIKVKILYRQGRLSIRVMNTYNNGLIRQGGLYKTSKADKRGHGYGLKNVQDVVDRYDGLLEITDKNGIFTVNVILYIE